MILKLLYYFYLFFIAILSGQQSLIFSFISFRPSSHALLPRLLYLAVYFFGAAIKTKDMIDNRTLQLPLGRGGFC
jgi:hypothetical protein